jgi:hypothetical protein
MFAGRHKGRDSGRVWQRRGKDGMRESSMDYAKSRFPGQIYWWSSVTLSNSASMVLLSTLKDGGIIALILCPHSKNDANPHVGQCSYSNGMAFPFLSFAKVLVFSPWLTLGGLPGKFLQRVAQGLDASPTTMGTCVHAALKQHWRGSAKGLQEAFILIPAAILADLCKQTRCQTFPSSWQAGKEIMILLGQKNG